MKPKQRLKIGIDILMTVLFLGQMAYHITGNALHEWMGICLFVLFFLHHILNGTWYAGLFRGRYTPVRVLWVSLNMLLFATMAGMMVSGVLLSREVFGFLQLRAGMFGRRLHMVSTAWGYLLMAAHIGLHWGMMLGIWKKRMPSGSHNLAAAAKVFAAISSIYGLYTFFKRQLWDRMFLLMEYAFFDYEEPAVFFFGDYICILICFASVSYYLSKLLRKQKLTIKNHG